MCLVELCIIGVVGKMRLCVFLFLLFVFIFSESPKNEESLEIVF